MIRWKRSRSARWAGIEGSPYEDTTELADRVTPAPPEEAALIERVGVSPEANDLTVGLPPAVDLERLEEAPLDDLIEAELIAMDEGDGESAAIIAAELNGGARRASAGERHRDRWVCRRRRPQPDARDAGVGLSRPWRRGRRTTRSRDGRSARRRDSRLA